MCALRRLTRKLSLTPGKSRLGCGFNAAEDVFRAVKQFAGHRRYVCNGRGGFSFPAAERTQVEAIKTRQSDITVAFQQALAEHATKLCLRVHERISRACETIVWRG